MLPGISKKLSAVLLVCLAAAWLYQAIQPPPAKICGFPNGPPITAPRIKLNDGRHLAYLESGVPKERPIIRSSMSIALGRADMMFFPCLRAGYGESDPDPKKTEKSTALDIEELADQLGLGPKFYVVGFSMGGQVIWGCLKYISHRLAGAALVGPVANYWWPGYPANVSKEAYSLQLVPDQWAVRVAHYAPWLTYWWNTQKWFPSSSVIANRLDIFSAADIKVLHKFDDTARPYMEKILHQGEFDSLHRDMIVGFGTWDFDPMDLDNPFVNGNGSVHLWHGVDDLIVPVVLSRYISRKLPWIRYHELPDAGHMFLLEDGMGDIIVKALVLEDQK